MERFYEDWHSLFDFDMHHLVVHWKRQHELCWCRSISVSNHDDKHCVANASVHIHDHVAFLPRIKEKSTFCINKMKSFCMVILFFSQYSLYRTTFICHFIFITVMQYFYPQASNAKYNWFISIGFGTKCDQIHSEIHAPCFILNSDQAEMLLIVWLLTMIWGVLLILCVLQKGTAQMFYFMFKKSWQKTLIRLARPG